MKLWLTILATLTLAACAHQPSPPPRPVEAQAAQPPSEAKPPLAAPLIHRYFIEPEKARDLNDVKLILNELVTRMGFAMNASDPVDMEKYSKLKHLLKEMP